MSNIWPFAGLLILALLSACSTVKISADYTPETDFSAYKTYRWVSARHQDVPSLELVGGDLFDRRMRHYVDLELARKGFTKEAVGKVDFKVTYDVLTEERQDIRTYNTGGYSGYGHGYYHGYGSYGVGSTETRVTNYTQGTVYLDIVHADSEVLVWRGTVDGRLTRDSKPDKREAKFEKVVGQLLANFPPRAAD